jgi:hypothetical protein
MEDGGAEEAAADCLAELLAPQEEERAPLPVSDRVATALQLLELLLNLLESSPQVRCNAASLRDARGF